MLDWTPLMLDWTQFLHDSSISKIDILKILSADFFADSGEVYVTLTYFFWRPLNLKNNQVINVFSLSDLVKLESDLVKLESDHVKVESDLVKLDQKICHHVQFHFNEVRFHFNEVR